MVGAQRGRCELDEEIPQESYERIRVFLVQKLHVDYLVFFKADKVHKKFDRSLILPLELLRFIVGGLICFCTGILRGANAVCRIKVYKFHSKILKWSFSFSVAPVILLGGRRKQASREIRCILSFFPSQKPNKWPLWSYLLSFLVFVLLHQDREVVLGSLGGYFRRQTLQTARSFQRFLPYDYFLSFESLLCTLALLKNLLTFENGEDLLLEERLLDGLHDQLI